MNFGEVPSFFQHKTKISLTYSSLMEEFVKSMVLEIGSLQGHFIRSSRIMHAGNAEKPDE